MKFVIETLVGSSIYMLSMLIAVLVYVFYSGAYLDMYGLRLL